MSTIISIGRAPAKLKLNAVHFDGQSAVPQNVICRIDEDTNTLVIGDTEDAPLWPLDDIREVRDQAAPDLHVLRLNDDPLQRLIFDTGALLPRLKNAHQTAPITKRGRLFGLAFAAIASVTLIVFGLVPRLADQLAQHIPAAGEQALGAATLDQIRSNLSGNELTPIATCTQNEAGIAALNDMKMRLIGAMAERNGLTFHVLDHDMINAFALPGGHVIVFKGLIALAETPEQLAAVLAHEIGHVVSRDPTRHALRWAGSAGVLGLLFGDFAGGTVSLFLANQLIDAQYSQTAETQADEYATQLLIAADISPSALSDMFQTFQKQSGDQRGIFQHFAAHPELGDRITATRDSMPDGFKAKELLTPDAWNALRQICDARTS